MIPIIVLITICGFAMGWAFCSYSWAKAAKNGKIKVVDGEMYKVKMHSDTHGGSVE